MVLDQGQPKAWYTLHPERQSLDWLTRPLPQAPALTEYGCHGLSGRPGQHGRAITEKPRETDYNWGLMVQEESPMALRLAEWLNEFAHDEMTLCDLGSGPGHFAEAIESRTPIQVDAYDIEFQSKDVLPLDLTKDSVSNCGLPYDIALCLEVAAHIEERFARDVVMNVCNSIHPKTGMVIWSAARAGQGGVGHVNCKPPEYWLRLFHEEDMRLCVKETANLIEFMKRGPHMGWFVRNVMVLEPRDKEPNASELIAQIPYAL